MLQQFSCAFVVLSRDKCRSASSYIRDGQTRIRAFCVKRSMPQGHFMRYNAGQLYPVWPKRQVT